jgi:hypothetical protein
VSGVEEGPHRFMSHSLAALPRSCLTAPPHSCITARHLLRT